ncbi:MAG TPA: 30S ribosomal protein S20 [Candidatus Baltobacteraceae bacterium]
MPNIKAAEKWSRQSEKRETRNRDAKSRLKTMYKKTAAGADADAAKTVEAAYDKAASKGIIHPNKAARKKSRLAKAMRKAASTPSKPAKKAAKPAKSAAKKPARKA